MQIGSVSTDHTASARASQTAASPPSSASPSISPHHRDNNDDKDHGTSATSGTGTGQQVNVVT